MHPASLPEDELLKQCEVSFTRGSGPGGQHRNKVQTKVVLTHKPTGISAQAGERRSQAANRGVAVFRLRLALALAVRTRRTGPSDLWTGRRRGRTLRVNPQHADFPALLAEALDMIAAAPADPGPALRAEPGLGGDVPTAAKALGVSTSQVVKLLKAQPAALEQVNADRARNNLPPLR